MDEERTTESTGDGFEDAYTKSRKLWKLYLGRKLTADELSERLGEYENNREAEKLKELFNGEDCK